MRPRALLSGGHTIEDLASALSRAACESFRHTPRHDSPLTPIERLLLRHSAQGWDTRRIARELTLSEGTIRNSLSRIFKKLGLDNRAQATLYYWGLWHMLDI
ncbi:response regulator transcription factor [Deinococcus aetherius]